MSYRLLDLEGRRPYPTVTLAPDENGLAVLVRRKGRPVAFWMESLESGTVLDPGALAVRVEREAGEALLRAEIGEDLDARRAPVLGMPIPSLTVAVCTRNRPEWLARCIGGIQRLELPTGSADPEILVVDNAPPDDRTRVVAADFGGVRYVIEPRVGLDFARNRALREARSDWVAFLDDDVVPDPRWMKGLAGAWQAHPDAAAVTGLVLPLRLETEAQILFEKAGGFQRGFRPRRYHGQELPGNSLYPCGAGMFGAGANMSFRRDVLLELGGFDEALDTGRPLPGGGDLDIFYRIIRAGHPLVYCPEALVFHEHRRGLAELKHQYYTWGLGFMAFVGKTFRSDPPQRLKILRLLRWWFRRHFRRGHRSLRGRCPLPVGMVLAEVRGGIVGLAGEYGRSRRRVERIRRSNPRVGP